jgi:hypothetical protein
VQNINPNERQILFIGIDAMLWIIWLSQNDIVFNKTSTLSYMQFIYRYPLGKDGVLFQKKKDQPLLLNTCQALETLTIEIFTKHGQFSNRLSL